MNRISHIAPLFGTSLTARSAGGTAPGKRIIVFSNRQKGTSHLLPAGWVLQDYLRYGAAGLATLLAARSGYANLAPLLRSTPPPLLPPPPPSPASRLYAMMLPFLSRVKTLIAGTAFVGGSGAALLGGAALLYRGEKFISSASVTGSTSHISPTNRSPVSPFTINSSSSTTPPVSPSVSNRVHSSPVLSPGTSTTEVPTNLEESTSANSSSSTTPPVSPSVSNSVHSSPVFQPNTSNIEVPEIDLENTPLSNSASSTTPPVSSPVFNRVHSSPVFQPNTSNIEIPEIDLENTPLSNSSSSTTPPVSPPVSNSVHSSPVLSPGTSTTEVPTVTSTPPPTSSSSSSGSKSIWQSDFFKKIRPSKPKMIQRASKTNKVNIKWLPGRAIWEDTHLWDMENTNNWEIDFRNWPLSSPPRTKDNSGTSRTIRILKRNPDPSTSKSHPLLVEYDSGAEELWTKQRIQLQRLFLDCYHDLYQTGTEFDNTNFLYHLPGTPPTANFPFLSWVKQREAWVAQQFSDIKNTNSPLTFDWSPQQKTMVDFRTTKGTAMASMPVANISVLKRNPNATGSTLMENGWLIDYTSSGSTQPRQLTLHEADARKILFIRYAELHPAP